MTMKNSLKNTSSAMMMLRQVATAAALLLLSSVTVALENHSNVNVPTFSLYDLLNGQRSEELSSVLSKTGLIAVVDEAISGVDDNKSSAAALQGLCRCTSDQEGFLSMDGTDTAVLDDGRTTRTTLATATAGTTPLPLQDSLVERCGVDTAHAMESLRDQIAVVSDAFIMALDGLLEDAKVKQLPHYHQQLLRPLLTNSDGGSYSSLSLIRDGANHLEHFHVYNKDSKEEDAAIDPSKQDEMNTLRWHTDAGLFLAFHPAVKCDDETHSHESDDTSFWVMDAQTQRPMQAVFPPGSVAVMLGAGAEHWLDTTSSPTVSLKATKHAVKMQNGDSRAWYGMMHLVPDRAIIQSSPKRTFADMKKAMTLSAAAGKDRTFGDAHEEKEELAPSIGCGFASEADYQQHGLGNATARVISSSRRRLQHVQGPSECNNVTNFFCWMQCLEIPNHEQARGYTNEGYSLYCLDPATLASTGNRVSSAAAPCEYGHVHNANCQGSWQPTAPGVTAYPVNVQVDDVQEQYCYGGTSMYMDGFHWQNVICVIYLFPSWVLSTPAKFAGATIGTLFVGIGLEKVIQQRRLVMSSMGPGYKRLGMSALFYGFQLTMGYFIMLVVMTYSGPLFTAVVLGLVGGHILFNANDAFFPGRRAPPAADEDSEEINDTAEDSSNGVDENGEDKPTCCGGKKPCCSSPKKNNKSVVSIPEGSTPCCQNTL